MRPAENRCCISGGGRLGAAGEGGAVTNSRLDYVVDQYFVGQGEQACAQHALYFVRIPSLIYSTPPVPLSSLCPRYIPRNRLIYGMIN